MLDLENFRFSFYRALTSCILWLYDSTRTRMEYDRYTKLYPILGLSLFVATFGFTGIFVVFFSIIAIIAGFVYILYVNGQQTAKELNADFNCLGNHHRQRSGISFLLANRERLVGKSSYEQQIHSMTGSVALDGELEQIMNYMMRDYVDSWYKNLTTDELFPESLKRTTRRSISALSQSMKQVDWLPFVTRHMVDDFASHLRLYRMASEKAERVRHDGKEVRPDDLLSFFFDFELEMEKNLCRDLLSTTPHYENAYLHDLMDIVLYLVMPPEDFRCRPLRFLLREVIVRRLIVPLLDFYSDPHEMNQLIVWLLSEVHPRPEDFIQCLENSKSIEELEAIFKSLLDEKMVLRGKDSGGEQGVFVKQQLGSLDFVEGIIKKKMAVIANASSDSGIDLLSSLDSSEENLVQLPIHVVLTNSIAVSYFMDFLQTVGGQNYIDCYLAIEGFKVSVEHQLRSLTAGEIGDEEVYETIKEAAQFMHQQYLSQEAITRVPLDEPIVSRFVARMRNDEPSDLWFEDIQEKIVEVLRNDDHFYPGFKKSPLYVKMLEDLGIIGGEEERSETPNSDVSNLSAVSDVKSDVPKEEILTGEPVLSAIVETLGVGCQGKHSFALYNIRVSRLINGQQVSSWNVLRRYNHFHILHELIVTKYPTLNKLSFPGKKTFNNFDSHFLEKRTKALNQFMKCILQPSLSKNHPELERILFDFLSQKEYTGTKEPLGKKMMSALFDPLKTGVKAVGNTVMSVPDQMIGGVVKIGAGINNATKSIITPLNGIPRAPIIETDRVAASITEEEATSSESIPLRVMVLLVDEVFGVRARNVWFRRQLMIMLRQLVTPFGSTLNKRIVDLVNWLTSEQQVAMYLAAIRESLWPDGQLAGEAPTRSADFRHRTQILAKCLMLSALPDQLRLILGADTTYQGINTISSALENKQLNRRLLYVFLERLLVTIFPENRFEKIFHQLHSKSPRSRRP